MVFYQEHNSKANYNYNAVIYSCCEWRRHFHKNPELVYVFDGELEVQIDSANYLLKKGDFALILPNQIHSHHTPVSSHCWIGVFSEDYVPEFAEHTKGKMGSDPVFTCTEDVFSFLKTHLLTEQIPNFFFLKAALTMVCGVFLKHAELVSRSDSDSDLAHEIIKVVEQNFQQNITLKSISESLGYEYHYLSRVFSRLFQTNFKAFLNEYRFAHAKHLLTASNKSLTEIAFECGFGSVRNFNRVYRELSGKAPTEK